MVAFMVFVGLFALLTVGLLLGLFLVILLMNKKFEEFTNKAEPAIVKLTDTLEQVQKVTVAIGERADSILARGEKMTETVSDNVEETTHVVRDTVTRPLINLNSLVAGLSKGFSVWSQSAVGGSKADRNGNGGV